MSRFVSLRAFRQSSPVLGHLQQQIFLGDALGFAGEPHAFARVTPIPLHFRHKFATPRCEPTQTKVCKSSSGSRTPRFFVQMVPAFDEFLIGNFNHCLPVP
jgi:hypothetical protein